MSAVLFSNPRREPNEEVPVHLMLNSKLIDPSLAVMIVTVHAPIGGTAKGPI